MKRPALLALPAALALGLSLTLAATSSAAPKTVAPTFKLGYVNLAVLYTLHPLVQYYVPEQGFFLNADETAGPDLFKQRAEKNAAKVAEIKGKINAIYAATQKFEDLKRQAQMRNYTDRRRVETDMEAARSNPGNQGKTLDFTKEQAKLKELDAALTAEMTKIETDRKSADADAIRLNDELKAINYYVGPEHEKHVQAIVDEVNACIRTVCDRKGIAVVFNSAQFHRTLAARESAPPEQPPAYEPANENGRASQYGKDQPLGKMIEAHGGLTGAKGLLDMRLDAYRDWMTESPRYLEPFREKNLYDFMPAGGEDLTADVMAEILTKHNVEQATIDLIAVGIKSRKIF